MQIKSSSLSLYKWLIVQMCFFFTFRIKLTVSNSNFVFTHMFPLKKQKTKQNRRHSKSLYCQRKSCMHGDEWKVCQRMLTRVCLWTLFRKWLLLFSPRLASGLDVEAQALCNNRTASFAAFFPTALSRQWVGENNAILISSRKCRHWSIDLKQTQSVVYIFPG